MRTEVMLQQHLSALPTGNTNSAQVNLSTSSSSSSTEESDGMRRKPTRTNSKSRKTAASVCLADSIAPKNSRSASLPLKIVQLNCSSSQDSAYNEIKKEIKSWSGQYEPKLVYTSQGHTQNRYSQFSLSERDISKLIWINSLNFKKNDFIGNNNRVVDDDDGDASPSTTSTTTQSSPLSTEAGAEMAKNFETELTITKNSDINNNNSDMSADDAKSPYSETESQSDDSISDCQSNDVFEFESESTNEKQTEDKTSFVEKSIEQAQSVDQCPITVSSENCDSTVIAVNVNAQETGATVNQVLESGTPIDDHLKPEEDINISSNESEITCISNSISSDGSLNDSLATVKTGSSSSSSGYGSSELSELTLTEEPMFTTGNETNASILEETCRNNSANESGSESASSFDDDEDELFKDFMPKKSCLKSPSRRSSTQLFIDTSANPDMDSANATSSPLLPPSSSPTCQNPLSTSSVTNSPSSTSQTSNFSNTSATAKKRVQFADNCGKELFTVRTMSEPSNCPPKLTSKIVQYFLNREFNNVATGGHHHGSTGSLNTINYGNPALNYLLQNNNSYQRYYSCPNGIGGDYLSYLSQNRSYDYGISGLTYTNDLNKLQGSIAVYALNFAQPAADYLKFRNRINEKNVSLENVFLNRFQLSGTIKVKNLSYNKQVFVRCSFNNWQSYQDFSAQYVANDCYTTSQPSSVTSSPMSSSLSATFYALNKPDYQPIHKDFDTFRFEFQLPTNTNSNGSSSNSTIQFCVCYKSDQTEYWDSNDGKNYEILQYIIDVEKLKPSSSQSNQHIHKSKSYSPSSSSSSNSSSSGSSSSAAIKQNSNYFKFGDASSITVPNGSKPSFSNFDEIYY